MDWLTQLFGGALNGTSPLPMTQQNDMNTFVGPTQALDPAVNPEAAARAAAADRPMGDKFMDALKGVRAPAAPEVQRISSPAAPRPTSQIKGGELIAFLNMLNGGADAANNYKLPSTLGAALTR